MPHQELIIDKVSPQIGQCNNISFLIELSKLRLEFMKSLLTKVNQELIEISKGRQSPIRHYITLVAH